MKKLVYFFSLAALLATSACKDDDGGSVNPSGSEISANGKTYVAKSGATDDWGLYDTDGDGEDDYYNYDFFVTDAQFVQNSAGDDYSVQGQPKFVVISELYAPSTTSFKTGTFTIESDESEMGDYICTFAAVYVDTNNNGNVNDEIQNDDFLEAVAGTVTVSGTNRNYTITYNLTLDNDKKVTGSYTGTFAYADYTGFFEQSRANARTANVKKHVPSLK